MRIAILAERLVQALAAPPGVPRKPSTCRAHAQWSQVRRRSRPDRHRRERRSVGQSRLVVVEVRGRVERHGPDSLGGAAFFICRSPASRSLPLPEQWPCAKHSMRRMRRALTVRSGSRRFRPAGRAVAPSSRSAGRLQKWQSGVGGATGRFRSPRCPDCVCQSISRQTAQFLARTRRRAPLPFHCTSETTTLRCSPRAAVSAVVVYIT